MTLVTEGDGSPVTTLTSALDQAALHGLMRQLYSMGMPMISVICIEVVQADDIPVLNEREMRVEE